jgi:hypothetical protein
MWIRICVFVDRRKLNVDFDVWAMPIDISTLRAKGEAAIRVEDAGKILTRHAWLDGREGTQHVLNPLSPLFVEMLLAPRVAVNILSENADHSECKEKRYPYEPLHKRLLRS